MGLSSFLCKVRRKTFGNQDIETILNKVKKCENPKQLSKKLNCAFGYVGELVENFRKEIKDLLSNIEVNPAPVIPNERVPNVLLKNRI